jgi:hypothetical protein
MKMNCCWPKRKIAPLPMAQKRKLEKINTESFVSIISVRIIIHSPNQSEYFVSIIIVRINRFVSIISVRINQNPNQSEPIRNFSISVRINTESFVNIISVRINKHSLSAFLV